MLSEPLQRTLNGIFQRARSAGAEHVTAEHLLLGLLDDAECREFIVSLGADVDELAKALESNIESSVGRATTRDSIPPAIGFQRALQRAVFQVQSAGRTTVERLDVLASILAEPDSKTTELLARQGIDRQALLNRLDVSAWSEISADEATAVAGHDSISHHAISTGASATPRSSIEQRFSELDRKLDLVTGEVRALAAAVKQLLERLPPQDS